MLKRPRQRGELSHRTRISLPQATPAHVDLPPLRVGVRDSQRVGATPDMPDMS
jgi:hypothetical protein